MKKLLAVSATLALACAVPRSQGAAPTIPIWVRSHHRSDVNVYLLCGDRDAVLLGLVRRGEGGAFEIPTSRAICARGLNFFLVPTNINQGYWVGPFRPRSGSVVNLTIEKYAPLSTASLRYGD